MVVYNIVVRLTSGAVEGAQYKNKYTEVVVVVEKLNYGEMSRIVLSCIELLNILILHKNVFFLTK